MAQLVSHLECRFQISGVYKGIKLEVHGSAACGLNSKISDVDILLVNTVCLCVHL